MSSTRLCNESVHVILLPHLVQFFVLVPVQLERVSSHEFNVMLSKTVNIGCREKATFLTIVKHDQLAAGQLDEKSQVSPTASSMDGAPSCFPAINFTLAAIRLKGFVMRKLHKCNAKADGTHLATDELTTKQANGCGFRLPLQACVVGALIGNGFVQKVRVVVG